MSRFGGELAGEVAIVTGGAHNIGRATCLALADAGAAVCVNAVSSAEAAESLAQEIEDAGGRAMHFVADVTEPDAVQAMTGAVVSRFGKLDRQREARLAHFGNVFLKHCLSQRISCTRLRLSLR